MKKSIMMLLGGLAVVSAIAISKPSMAEAAQTEAKYMEDVLIDEAHFPDENFRKNVENFLDVNKDGILSKAEREDVYYAEIGGVGYKDTWWYTDMKFSE
ncbi:MAG: hypothetical protein J6B84_03010, partial [Eubacterium sp.]|nr:hypothetical protein [Eubacterium sp.]